ncbi:DUF2807 domain-containing protein [Sphingomonas sp. I4]
MMKMISTIALLSIATAAPAQDAAPGNAPTSRGFAMHGFDRIELSGCDIVTVAIGSGYAVTAQGRAANIDNLRIDMTGSTLRIRRRNDSCNGHDRRVAIAVTLPSLKAVDVSGAVGMNLPALDARAFAVDASGASVLRLAGLRSASVSFDLSGASRATIGNLQADRVSIGSSGPAMYVSRVRHGIDYRRQWRRRGGCAQPVRARRDDRGQRHRKGPRGQRANGAGQRKRHGQRHGRGQSALHRVQERARPHRLRSMTA